ncbi:MAG: GNAT family N-acyltransferase [Chitinophagales bacterium]
MFTIHTAKTNDEKEEIYRFRYKIYIEELKKLHFVADHNKKQLYDEADNYCAVYYVKNNDGIIGTCRAIRGTDGQFTESDISIFNISFIEQFIEHEKIAVVNRLIIDKSYRHTNLVHQLFLESYLGGLKEGTRICFVTCDSMLLHMYIKYGFRTFSDPVQLNNKQTRFLLFLSLCDLSYLKSINSPFVPYLPTELDDHGFYAKKMETEGGFNLSLRKPPVKDRILYGVAKTIFKLQSKAKKIFSL